MFFYKFLTFLFILNFYFKDSTQLHIWDLQFHQDFGHVVSSNLSAVNPEKLDPKGLYVYDDNGHLVPVTLDSPPNIFLVVDFYKSVKFTLYTRSNPKGEELIINNIESLKNSSFNPVRRTVIVAHGWMNSEQSPACQLVKNAYLKQDDFNVITVDWGKIAKNWNYLYSAGQVQGVGEHVGTMVNFLASQGMNSKTTTLIGHSLGAHVAGIAGHKFRDLNDYKDRINFLYGLDPALPDFATGSAGTKISRSDADYVEVIHTCSNSLGIYEALGDADFYPNGGVLQPGCSIPFVPCSHSRSYEYLSESINSDIGFTGKKCEHWYNNLGDYSWTPCDGVTMRMGGIKDKVEINGYSYVETREASPFARES